MRIHEVYIIPGIEYGTIRTEAGRNLRAIRVAPGPWLWAELSPASDELPDNPIGAYWEEVVDAFAGLYQDIEEEGAQIEVIDEGSDPWGDPAMGEARRMTEGMAWEFTGWGDTLAMLKRWARQAVAP